MGVKVTKFGGSSLCDAQQYKKVANILAMDKTRQVVVPSAPGKRSSNDIKVTDMLLACHGGASFDGVRQRFMGIVQELDIDFNMESELHKVEENIKAGASIDYVASRGEYLSGMILSHLLGWRFIDSADVIKFNDKGQFLSEESNSLLAEALRGGQAVLPGFFGSNQKGEVVTFSRGGSDITGALASRAVQADVYENWTDVSGFFMTDPRIVPDAKHMETISYRELRELSYMGAGVLHEDSVFPVRQAGIPVNIRNTNDPEAKGTFIVTQDKLVHHGYPITGVAGKKGFTVIMIEKAKMNNEMGFARRVLSVIEDHQISIEHMPTGIDTLSIIVSDAHIEGKLKSVVEGIEKAVNPDVLEVYANLALIATVGHGMVKHLGTAAKLFNALAKAKVNIRMIDQGSSELNIIVGVEDKDFERSVEAIYRSFIND